MVCGTAEEERLAAEARQVPSVVIDRETRRQLLNYFVFCPPENDKKASAKTGSIGAISSSVVRTRRGGGTQQEESDALGSSGRGARFSRSVRGVLSRLPTLNNPTPDPAPLPGATSPSSALASPLPTSSEIEEASGVNPRESSGAGESEVQHRSGSEQGRVGCGTWIGNLLTLTVVSTRSLRESHAVLVLIEKHLSDLRPYSFIYLA